MKVKGSNIKLPVSIFREGKAFVAYTPVLDISTCGDTLAEAKRRFNELVWIFFKELKRKGTTDEVLTSFGWRKVGRSLVAPVEVDHRIESVRVPVRV